MEPIKDDVVCDAIALGELTAGDLDISGKLHAVEEVVQRLCVHEIRGGASVLRDEDRSVRLADTPYVHLEVVSAFRERNDVLGRAATVNWHFANSRHVFISCDVNFGVTVNGGSTWLISKYMTCRHI